MIKKIFANHIACGLVVVVVIGIIACSGTSSPSDFKYDLNQKGDGVVILGYKGKAKEVVVPSEIEKLPVTEIGQEDTYGNGALSNNSSVTSIVIPDSVKIIFGDTFAANSNLKKVTLPADFKVSFYGQNGLGQASNVLPRGMFRGCNELSSFTIPKGITFIGASAFESTGLTSIVIPEGVTIIAASAFLYCKNLKSVTLPQSLKVLGPGAFDGCSSLETITLPSHKLEWNSYQDYDLGLFSNHDSQAFRGCTKLSLQTRKAIQDLGYPDGFTN